jgi:hypothetical protein
LDLKPFGHLGFSLTDPESLPQQFRQFLLPILLFSLMYLRDSFCGWLRIPPVRSETSSPARFVFASSVADV